MIRKANLSDIDGIISLLYQVHDIHAKGRADIFKDGGIKYRKDDLENVLLNENTPVFVFEDEAGEILGHLFCQIKITKETDSVRGGKNLYIDDLCIDEKARGQNIGAALYEYAQEYAKSIGCNAITLSVWEFNSGARKFYEKCGMKPQKTIMEQIL